MKRYVTPTLEVQELLQEEELAAVIRSEPTVEDDDLSV